MFRTTLAEIEDAYFEGFDDGRKGLVTGLTYDNDPNSVLSRTYDRGRTMGERHVEAYGDAHDEECPICGVNA